MRARAIAALLLGLPLLATAADPADAARASAAADGKSISIVVAYPPGGVSDRMARLLALRLAQDLGVAVRVDNQAGAGGSIALRALARLPGDGRHMVFTAVTSLLMDPQVGGATPAVAPLAAVMSTPFLLVGTPAFAGQDFADLMRLARTQAMGLRWATSGVGTTGHVVLEAVRQASGGRITHVPYKGGGQQLNDALGGQFELLSTNVGALQLEYVQQRRLTPLAVGAPQRLPLLPKVPTLAELGLPQANHGSLFGLFVPASTPPSQVRRLNIEVMRALRSAEIRSALLESGSLPGHGSAADFAAEIEREARRIKPLLNDPPR